MSGAMRRIGEYLGLLEDTDGYEDDLYEGDDDQTRSHEPVREPVREPARRPKEPRPAPVADLSERRRATVVPAVQDLSRIITLTPTTYNEARSIGENYRDGTPVIMNLSEMDDADAKRLVDFAAGLIFATYGNIERVTNKVFLLSPANVSVTAEAKQRIVEGGFFNQS
ncbi:MAG: cell division protein SepF [Nocardioides sp.]|nr:cell division protein SepF [Nocardioides sp.]